MFYCEGQACQKREQCIFHHPEKHPEAAKHNMLQYIDRSLTGTGGANSNGECWTTWDCGDNGNYALFEPILQDDYEGALKDYNEGLELDENYSYLYLRRGKLYSQMDRMEDANNDFVKLGNFHDILISKFLSHCSNDLVVV